MPVAGRFPYLQRGVIGAGAAHYSTDGMQFFGLSSKETGIPAALCGNLADLNLQYEFAYTGLQTEKLCVSGTKTLSFYGFFQKDHPDAVTKAAYQEEIMAAYRTPLQPAEPMQALSAVTIKSMFDSPVSSDPF